MNRLLQRNQNCRAQRVAKSHTIVRVLPSYLCHCISNLLLHIGNCLFRQAVDQLLTDHNALLVGERREDLLGVVRDRILSRFGSDSTEKHGGESTRL